MLIYSQVSAMRIHTDVVFNAGVVFGIESNLTSVYPGEAASTQSWTCSHRSRKATSEGSKFMWTDFRFVYS